MNQYILTPIEHKDVIIPASISSKVLTVGLEHKHHRGGIGGVIDTYSKYFQVFNFVSTYKPQKFKVAIIPYFILSCTKLILKLIYNNNIKIIHIHGAARGSIYRKFIVFLISKYLFHCKVIYHSHGSEFEVFYKESNFYTRKLIKFFMENVSLII